MCKFYRTELFDPTLKSTFQVLLDELDIGYIRLSQKLPELLINIIIVYDVSNVLDVFNVSDFFVC